MKIYIPSRGRATKVITRIPPAWQTRAYLVVPADEADEYVKYNPGIEVLPHNEDGITATRQWIIDHAKTDYIAQLDDDLKILTRIDVKNPAKLVPAEDEDLDDMFQEMERMLKVKGYAGVCVNKRFMQQNFPSYKENRKLGEIWAINRKPMIRDNLRLNLDIGVMEDFHITLMLITHGYPTVLLSDWVHNAGTNTAGGCSIFRTAAVQQKAITYIHSQFPKYFKPKKPVYDDETMHESPGRIAWANMEKDCMEMFT